MTISPQQPDDPALALVELRLKIDPSLHRAFQRCTWIIVHETGRSQLEVMREMVEDFLRKHGC